MALQKAGEKSGLDRVRQRQSDSRLQNLGSLIQAFTAAIFLCKYLKKGSAYADARSVNIWVSLVHLQSSRRRIGLYDWRTGSPGCLFEHEELAMARRVLECPDCKEDFTHSMVPEQGVAARNLYAWVDLLFDKPDLPTDGASLECPYCKKTSTYQRRQLIYRAD
jgi:hypothetical protein